MIAGRIRHTVAFTLAHPEGSAAERDFLEAAERLALIPGVEAFELLAEGQPEEWLPLRDLDGVRRPGRVRWLQRAPGSRAVRAGALAGRGERLSRARLRGARAGTVNAPRSFKYTTECRRR